MQCVAAWHAADVRGQHAGGVITNPANPNRKNGVRRAGRGRWRARRRRRGRGRGDRLGGCAIGCATSRASRCSSARPTACASSCCAHCRLAAGAAAQEGGLRGGREAMHVVDTAEQLEAAATGRTREPSPKRQRLRTAHCSIKTVLLLVSSNWWQGGRRAAGSSPTLSSAGAVATAAAARATARAAALALLAAVADAARTTCAWLPLLRCGCTRRTAGDPDSCDACTCVWWARQTHARRRGRVCARAREGVGGWVLA